MGQLPLIWLECWAGELAAATAVADRAGACLGRLANENGRALGLAAQAQVDAYAGRVPEATEQAEAAVAILRRSGWAMALWRPLTTIGFAALSQEDPQAAVAALVPALPDPATFDATQATVGEALWLADAAEALVAVGRLDEAQALADRLDAVRRIPDRGWAVAVAERARGLLLAARGELAAAEEALERALVAHAGLPLPVERARTGLALGRVRRRRRRRRAAAEALEPALATLTAAGCAAWARQAQIELDGLGLHRGEGGGLTPSELRVARLAAAGRTNREVGEALYISPKTVEAHLARAYRKLGIRSRAELGARMVERDQDGEAVEDGERTA